VLLLGEKNVFKKSKLFGTKGFYVTLSVLICIVAVTAVYMSQNNLSVSKKTPQNVASVQQTPVKTTDPLLTKDKVNTVMTSKQKVKSIKDVTSVTAKSKKLTSKGSAIKKSTKMLYTKNFKLVYPVKGKITKKFDNKELQYSQKMGQWETHEGIDIACSLGTIVTASMGGKVVDVIKSDNTLNSLSKDGFGDGIVVDNGNGYRTEYLNLASDSLKLKKGDVVKVGQVLGKVGNTSLREAIDIEGSHLHFVVLKKSGNNYLSVNPQQFLK
jgi:murein DD-endopeptidase MepM/ murein hydrolase activator NlpD